MTSDAAPARRYPRVSVGLPIVGPHAGPAAIEQVATAADRLGFRTASVPERILLPADPEWLNAFGLPDWPAYDAIETLTWVAAKTERLRLRTDVIVPVYQQPVVLARRLATLDHFSGARLEVGVAVGWLDQEFQAVGIPPKGRVARFEECVAALRACWAPDPVRIDGEHYRIPPSKIGPKPMGAIPLLVGGISRLAIERAAQIGDGVTMAFRSWDATSEQIKWYRDAGGSGRIVLRGGPMLADAEHETPPPTWTETHIVDSLEQAAAEGVDEFSWDLNIVGYAPAHQVELLEALAVAIDLPGGRRPTPER